MRKTYSKKFWRPSNTTSFLTFVFGFVTSTTSNNIDSVFKTLNGKVAKKDFDFIGNQNMVQKLKPHPDIYLEALRVLEITIADCIAIEDSVESALSAHSAKIDCIAFPGKFHKDDNFSFCKNFCFRDVGRN